MRWLVFLAALLLAAPAMAQAQSVGGQSTPHAQARLAADGAALTLRIALDPGWHIYWKDPGQSGLPPTLALDPPAVAGPFAWPAAHETLVQAGLRVNVLSGAVSLPFTATGLPAGAARVSGTLRMLVCSDTLCIPERARLTAALGAGGGGTPFSLAALAAWLAGALLGGLILNLMPCVFPVLAIKAVALARLGAAARGAVRRECALYGAGVVASMLGLGALLLGLRAAGLPAGWGFQFQSPAFVAAAALLMLAIALNLAGAFELRLPGGLSRAGGPAGAFATGILAVLVATPCTAPFMAGALAASLAGPPLAALAVFAGLGVGLASPFLLIALAPSLARALPRPGAWMAWLRRILSLPMFATAAWLFWVLHAALSPTPPALPPGAQAYTAPRLAALRAAGRPVLVDLTAAWCLTCQVNDRLVLNTPAARRLFAAGGAVLLVGDWTNGAPAVTAYLKSQGRDGVPLYVAYAPGKPGVVLAQILTLGAVAAGLKG